MAGPNQSATGFLEELGLGNEAEQTAFRQDMDQKRLRTSSSAGDFMQLGQKLGRQIAPLAAGVGAGVKGLINGEGGRGFREFGRDVTAGATNLQDDAIARSMGLQGGREELRAKRNMIDEIKQAKASFTDDGSFTNRIELAKKVVAIANRNGDVDVAAKALRQVSELEKEQQEFEKAGIANETAARKEQEDKDDGISGESIKNPGVPAKFIKEPTEGGPPMYRMIVAGKPDEIVPASHIVKNEDLVRQTAANKTPQERASDSLFTQVARNIGGTNKVPETRRQMTDMVEVANIVGQGIGALNHLADPQAGVSAIGAVQVGADKVIAFGESLVSLWTSDDKNDDGGLPGWRNEDGTFTRMSKRQQYDAVTKGGSGGRRDTILDQFMTENGLASIQEMLPSGMKANTKAGQLYLANIMELAYLDARIQEPSNRGLSDNDIKAALTRIGANSADPTVFAERQLQNNRKMQRKLNELGQGFNNFGTKHSVQSIVDAVYDPEVRNSSLETLQKNEQELIAFIERGRRGDGTGELFNPEDGTTDFAAAAGGEAVTETREQRKARLLGEGE